MSIQLHTWFDLFREAYKLPNTIENQPSKNENMGIYLMNYLIDDAKTSLIYKNSYNNVMALKLAEFHLYWNKTKKELTDLVYDKKTGYVLINFRYNSSIVHEHFVGYMYNAITNQDLMPEAASELYIDHYGFFKSSASHGKRIIIGENLTLTADEKITFKDWNFVREDFSR